jgi:hypothetical protein
MLKRFCHPSTSVDECLEKMWSAYIMEVYSAIKKNRLMSFVGKLMEFTVIVLNKINQTHKDIHHAFFLTCAI